MRANYIEPQTIESKAWGRMNEFLLEAISHMSRAKTEDFIQDFSSVRGDSLQGELEAKAFIGAKFVWNARNHARRKSQSA